MKGGKKQLNLHKHTNRSKKRCTWQKLSHKQIKIRKKNLGSNKVDPFVFVILSLKHAKNYKKIIKINKIWVHKIEYITK